MLIAEVCKATGLTKKAVEYYTEQGFIAPALLSNGYRDFSESDAEKLRKIRVLRLLDMNLPEIQEALSDSSGEVFHKMALKRSMEIRRDAAKSRLLQRLASGEDVEAVAGEAQALEAQEVVAERLLNRFPGYYGRFLCLHFARFLTDPVSTQAQRAAFDRVVRFLDGMPALTFPEDVQALLAESTAKMDNQLAESQLTQMGEAFRDMDAFYAKNKEALDAYAQFRASDAYRNSPVYRLRQIMKDFFSCSGYYDEFLPAMEALSPAYAAYRRQLEMANEKFLAEHPEYKDLEG